MNKVDFSGAFPPQINKSTTRIVQNGYHITTHNNHGRPGDCVSSLSALYDKEHKLLPGIPSDSCVLPLSPVLPCRSVRVGGGEGTSSSLDDA